MSALGRGAERPTLIGRLIAGDVDGIRSLLSDDAEIHDPHQGRIRGREPIERHLRARSDWFRSVNAVAEPLDVTVGATGLELEEVDARIDGPQGPATMPIAMVLERDATGLIRELRSYFPAWFIRGEKSTRSPVLPADPSISGASEVETYHRLLAAGDGPGMAELFAEESYVREPLGTLAQGIDEVKRWHAQFAEGGGAGMPLNWCSIIDDGQVSAFEYMAEQWGTTVFAPIGGIVVFVRDAAGRFTAVRVYEEASPEQ